MLDTLAGVRLPFAEVEKILSIHGVAVETLDHLIILSDGVPAPTMRLIRTGGNETELGIQHFEPEEKVADYVLWKWALYFQINPSVFGIVRV